MARRVLGNDPFLRGAAPRGGDVQPPPPSPVKRAPTKPPRDTPELQTPPPPASAARSPAASGPRPHAGSPSVPFEATPHSGSPSALPLGDAPSPHAGAPSVSFEATPHPDSPTAVPLGSTPRPHAGSPSVPFDATPHASAPSVAPRAHAGAPSVSFEATPHPDSPTAVPLGTTPSPHAGSPSVPFDATPHASAPSVSREAPPPPESSAAAPLGTSPGVAPTPRTWRASASLPSAVKGLWRALRTASGLPAPGAEVDAWGKDSTLTSQLRPLAELLVDRYWRVRTEGVENVPRGGCILVANHAGALPLDGPVLHLALQRDRPDLAGARWLLEDQVFHAPFVGLLANRLGAVRASPENALRLLAEGRPVVVFPEGFHGLSKGFGERYQLRRFGRGGSLKIAIRARVPVIPVAIVGGEESMPLLGKLPGGLFGVEHLPVTLPPLPARWFIRFGPPIDLSGAPAAPEDDLAWIERTNLAVRDQVKGMLTDLLARRKRVF